jgi:hypothetical protein
MRTLSGYIGRASFRHVAQVGQMTYSYLLLTTNGGFSFAGTYFGFAYYPRIVNERDRHETKVRQTALQQTATHGEMVEMSKSSKNQS